MTTQARFNLYQLTRVLTPAIQVHGWGGLGSQMLTLVAARRVANRFRGRRVVIVLHTSGVTRRIRELPHIQDFNILQLDDFNTQVAGLDTQKESFKLSLFLSLKQFLRILAVHLNLLSELNDESSFKQLPRLACRITGTYSQMKLTNKEITWLNEILLSSTEEQEKLYVPAVALHYRYGDLPTVKQNSIISLAKIIEHIFPTYSFAAVDVYSDSSETTLNELLDYNQKTFIREIHNLNTLSTIKECVKATCFIGTNSKISYWISLFRLVQGSPGYTIVPTEMREALIAAIGQVRHIERLRGYDV